MKRTTKLSKRQQKFAAWVAALRSGKFQQGYGRLQTLNRNGTHPRYCCLGVYCKIARPGAFLAREMPEQYVVSAGVDGGLAGLNDDRVPFEVIAGVIHHNFVVPS